MFLARYATGMHAYKMLEPWSKEGLFASYDKTSPDDQVYCPQSMKVERVEVCKIF